MSNIENGKGSDASTCSLFAVMVLHGGPKSQHTSIETYIVATSESEVAEWINKERQFGCWFTDEEGEPIVRFDDDDYEKEIPFKEWVLKNRGDINDDKGWDDAYYGVTKWGWKPIPSSPADIETLLRLGVAIPANVKGELPPSQE